MDMKRIARQMTVTKSGATAGSRKLRAGSGFLASLRDKPRDILATIEVSREDYVPSCVRQRQQLAPTLFTALIPAHCLDDLLDDEHVVLVEPSTTFPAD